MQFTTLTSVALLGALELASAKNIPVTVGPDFNFHPETITADKGDSISFKINQGHSVNMGSFNQPCQWSTLSSGSDAGGKTWTITVNDTNPIYGFCGTPAHCSSGMVFAVNPPSSGNTLSKYKSLAKAVLKTISSSNQSGGTFGQASSNSSNSSTSSTASSSGGSTSSTASGSGTAATSSRSTGAAAPGAHGQEGFFTAAVMMVAGGLSWFL